MTKKKATTKNNSENYTNVLLEKMNSKIDLVLEQHSGLRDTMDKMDVRLSNVEDKVTGFSLRLYSANDKLDGLKRDIKDSYKSTSDYLLRIEKEVAPVKAEIKDLKSRLKEKADVARLFVLEKKIEMIEKKLSRA
ncbi:MAG TPA: hypothetical protein DIT25_04575 [Candidatus Moranbacteria bacterium]|nr:hypothetical protein [Candidatus Moranbacteria bacterium]